MSVHPVWAWRLGIGVGLLLGLLQAAEWLLQPVIWRKAFGIALTALVMGGGFALIRAGQGLDSHDGSRSHRKKR